MLLNPLAYIKRTMLVAIMVHISKKMMDFQYPHKRDLTKED